MERETLDFAAGEVRAVSRLACQISLTDAHNDLILHVVGEWS